MSFSAPHSKMPSPARTPRESSEDARDDRRVSSRKVHRPPGIINLGMTCFLNSTFQALAATPAIISLLSHNPALPLSNASHSILPAPAQAPGLTPCLSPDALEPPLYSLLPVTRAFTNSLHKAWTTKERGGGISGPGESSSLHCITISQLLKEMAKKYDQYDAFAQQDAHELLRHLLDSMEMEEKDVIKRKQAQAASIKSLSSSPEQSRSLTVPSPMALPTPLAPPSPGLGPDGGEQTSRSAPLSPNPSGLLFEDQMLPFVDLLFGGLLASVVVCDTCKSVSHTYEGFLDLSLSMRGDDDAPRVRKRDRFRAITSKFKGRKGLDGMGGVMSEPEGSDTDVGLRLRGRHGHGNGHGHGLRHGRERHGPHRDSDVEDNVGNGSANVQAHSATNGHGTVTGNNSGASLSRASSSAKSLKASFSFRKKSKGPGTSPSLSTSPAPSIPPPVSLSAPDTPPHTSPSLSPQTESAPLLPQRPHSPLVPHSPKMSTSSSHQTTAASPTTHPHQAAPTPAQAAYIARILYGPPTAPESADPLAKLRAAHAGGLSTPHKQEYGLIESLRAFTGVETLEGDNAFACHKCWKIKNGRYKSAAGAGAGASAGEAKSSGPSALSLPAIAVEDSETDLGTQSSSGEMSRLGRLMNRGKNIPRATSPLRQLVETYSAADNAEHAEEFARTDTVSSTDSMATSNTSATFASASSGVTIDTAGTSVSSATMIAPQPMDVSTIDSMSREVEAIDIGASNGAVLPDVPDAGEASEPTEAEAERESSDGLSDSETDDESSDDLNVRSPRFFRTRSRKPSKHFILRRAFKRYLIAKAPEVLVFHIKRFKQTGSDMYSSTFSSLRKLDDPVTFPEVLDLAPFMAPNRADFKTTRTADGLRAAYMDWPAPERPPEPAPMLYKLYAVVVHLGTMLSGHYIAYVLVDPEKVLLAPGQTVEHSENGPEKKDRRVWCYCSDTEIRLASVDEVLAARAYLCFYESMSPEKSTSSDTAA